MATRSPVCADVTACDDGYALGWNISLIDPHALWEAAAARLSTWSGSTHQDIEATLGPREDPSITDCLIALLPPVSIPSCETTSVLCHRPDIADRTEADRLSSHVVYR